MKRIIQIVSFLAFAVAFANVEANAQAFGKRFEADVSFDFVIGEEVFPAGKYYLRVAGNPNGPGFLEVRDAERDIVADRFFLGQLAHGPERLRVVFLGFLEHLARRRLQPGGSGKGFRFEFTQEHCGLRRLFFDSQTGELSGTALL